MDERGQSVFAGRRYPGYAEAKLAAAAPDLVRALLLVEWASTGLDENACPDCGVVWGGADGNGSPPHMPDCRLDAALRKAGAR